MEVDSNEGHQSEECRKACEEKQKLIEGMKKVAVEQREVMNITPNVPQRMSHNIPLAGNLEDNATVTARISGAAQSFPFIHIIKNFCVVFIFCEKNFH